MFRLSGNKLTFIIILFISTHIFANTIKGKVEKRGNKYLLITKLRSLEISNKRWNVSKFIGYTLEIKNPQIRGKKIFFKEYKILETPEKKDVNSSYREILSEDLKRIDLDFNVYREGNYLYFSLLIINNSIKPVKLKFPSEEEVDFVVMDGKLKNTIWRWSWNKKYKIGYTTEVILPHSSLKYYAKWNIEKSYVENGLYKVFAELHSLPHGILSEVRSIILNTPSKYIPMDFSLIPLESGMKLKYSNKEGLNFVMTVTGTAIFNGRKYYVVENFPDENLNKKKENSRFIRFDPKSKKFMEYLAGKEVPLFKGKFKIIKDEKENTFSFIYFLNNRWKEIYKLKKGIGIVEANILKDKFFLKKINFSLSRKAPSPSFNENLILIEKGGFEKKDILYSISGNGTLVVLKEGRIISQLRIDREKFQELIDEIERMGIFQMENFYGKNSVEDPLTTEIVLKGDKNFKIVVKTSKSDKPPLSFWLIVDKIKEFIKEAVQKNEN